MEISNIKPLLKGIGLPFNPDHSSCSNIKPTNFKWSVEEGIYDVHIDQGLKKRPDPVKSKSNIFGWVCESKDIIPHIYDHLIRNHAILFDQYYNKIFTCDTELIKLNENFIYCPNGSNYPWVDKQKWNIYTKTKLCSMFCSTKLLTEGHVFRHSLAKMAIENNFDVFGGAHGTQRTVIDINNPWYTKIDGLKNYMFSIVVENSNYDSYYTEKITDCFATGTIPVYCGTKKAVENFDSDGIIYIERGKEEQVLKTLTPKLYNSKLNAINNNFNSIKKLQIADDYLFNLLQLYV